MAVRTISCLPAVVGAWRDVGGGALLSTSGAFPVDDAALQRPDLVAAGTRTLNMSQLGRVLTDTALAPPVKALFVYNSNPAAVAPEQEKVREGLAREDLFTVVHDLFQTDTVDFADVFLPATTTLEHFDLHKAYGHLYLSLSRPGDRAARRGRLQHGAVPPARGAHGPRPPVPARERRADGAGRARLVAPEPARASRYERLEREGSRPAVRAGPLRALRRGRLPDAVGQVRAALRAPGGGRPRPGRRLRAAARGPDERARAGAALPARFHLAAGAPLPELDLLRAAGVRAPRGRGERHAAPARCSGPRHRRGPAGARLQRPRLVPRDGARVGFHAPGVVVGLSIWWAKMCPGGRNANAVTSQELTDMGGGATFYDVLVEVTPAEAPAQQQLVAEGAAQRGNEPGAASEAGFTPAQRAGGLGGAAQRGNEPGAASEAGFTPAQRAGGLGGAAQRGNEPGAASEAGFTPAQRAGGLGGAAQRGNEPGAASEAGFTPAQRAGGLGARRSAATSQGLRVKRDSLPRSERGSGGRGAARQRARGCE